MVAVNSRQTNLQSVSHRARSFESEVKTNFNLGVTRLVMDETFKKKRPDCAVGAKGTPKTNRTLRIHTTGLTRKPELEVAGISKPPGTVTILKSRL